MNRKHLYFYLIMAAIVIAGIYIGDFWGGILVGIAIVLVPLVVIGRNLAHKAAARMDKRMRDIIVDHMDKEG